jgi:superfamily II DNA or RNA helicase
MAELTITIKNSWSTLSGKIPSTISHDLGADIVSFYTVKKYGKLVTERKVNHISLYNNEKHYYPTGLTRHILSACKREGISYIINDRRVRPNHKPFPVYKDIPIREFMEEGFKIACDKGRGILLYGTGTGKTNCLSKLIQHLGCKSLYVVPSKGLLQQTANVLKEYINTSIGVIGDGFSDYVFENGNKYIPNITVITIQSLWNIHKNNSELFNFLVDEIEFIGLDECHHTRYTARKDKPYNSWYITMMKFKNAFYRIGMTATMYGDRDLGSKMLEGVTSKVQHQYTRIEAENDGIVCPFEVRVYPVMCEDNKNWQISYKNGIVLNNNHNDTVISATRRLVEEGRKVIVIFDEVENHIKEVAKMLPEAGVLTGKDSGSYRLEVQDKFAKGEINIILTTVMSEGINIPSIDAVVLASGKGSEKTAQIKVSQRIGRGSRVAEGKDNLIVVDFLHNGNHMLYKHSRNRIKIMEQLGGKIVYMKDDAVFA